MGEVDQSQTESTTAMPENGWQTITVGKKGYLERIGVHITTTDAVEGTLRIYEGEGASGEPRWEQSVRLAAGLTDWTWIRLIHDLKVSPNDVLTMVWTSAAETSRRPQGTPTPMARAAQVMTTIWPSRPWSRASDTPRPSPSRSTGTATT